MKEINKSAIKNEEDLNGILSEINVMKTLDHPSILKIYEFYQSDQSIFIINEFCDHGCLCDLEKPDSVVKYPEILVKYLMKRSLEALVYMHKQGFSHGDIKGENIMLSSKISGFLGPFKELIDQLNHDKELLNNLNNGKFGEKEEAFIKRLSQYDIKLIDFGFARLFKRKQKEQKGSLGTPYFYAPEADKGAHTKVGDEWAIGVLMYLLLTGDVPFGGDSMDDLLDHIVGSEPDYRALTKLGVSDNCINLIKKLLIKDPEKRLKAKDALKEPFFIEKNYLEDYLSKNISRSLSFNLKSARANFIRHRTYQQSKFKEMVIAYITFNFMTKTEENKIRELFDEMNKGGAGHIQREQFISIMKAVDSNFTEEELNEMFDMADTDKSGSIEYQELLRAMSNKSTLLTKENLKEAFDLFDIDKGGSITFDEVEKIVFKGKVNEEILNGFLMEVNKKKDDPIHFEEFCEIMMESNEEQM